MATFYLAPELRPEDCLSGSVVSVTGSEARHAVTVSRIRSGERLLIGNGAGLMLAGTVVTADPAEFTLRVDVATETPPSTPRIRLVQALAKGDRDEMAIQAATELGIDGVIPWAAARSVSRWEGPKVAKGQERWSSIVREASKQSIRPWLPTIGALASTKQLAVLATTTRMLLLEPTASVRLTDVPAPNDDRDIVLVVGPEGGISPGELSLLEQAGATQVRLGDTVLRTSTAGPAALAILNATLGRW
ncbi:16S rRNA (uracil(1498)-N(3))-methyltransferase [Cryobacterium psychrophilum]|uniref:Ribosomal RNA small subunit methyltransferase E n=1 Tax=Cryobacterium psychrophilum TaxID=41988 RepID=A0A4Y8KSN5_9MICO|nr:16S rRNA (uracil(1498)-N(3))-methyltransferase [Cryobacterium psychrophilum]TDW31538.1 16S rRNA (uracil1498-N3)-methyltransferase [Cryobacterium psychrophilum]TFD79309.1 16S rRNA (uracil(1498)-N(3))-methyltransferase [Cryobacterium psychrophilum]